MSTEAARAGEEGGERLPGIHCSHKIFKPSAELGLGQTSHSGRTELNGCIRRNQNATFDSIEYGSFNLGRPKLLNSTDAVALCDTRYVFGSNIEFHTCRIKCIN